MWKTGEAKERHFWDEAPILEDARVDPFISPGSDDEHKRRLVDFFAPYIQVPLPASSSESEGEEVAQQQRQNPTPPCSPNPSRYVTFACAATSPTPPSSADVLRPRTSSDENEVSEQESVHAAHRMQRPKLSASRLRGRALRGRSLPVLTRQDSTTSWRSTSQEKPVSKEESQEIRAGLQYLINVSQRLEKMKETQAPRPVKRANLYQQDSGRGDCMPNGRDLRASFFQQALHAEPSNSAFRVPAHQRLGYGDT